MKYKQVKVCCRNCIYSKTLNDSIFKCKDPHRSGEEVVLVKLDKYLWWRGCSCFKDKFRIHASK